MRLNLAKAVTASFLIVLACNFPAQPVFAQSAQFQLQQQQMTTARMVTAVDKFADTLKDYYSNNKTLPKSEAEMDKFLTDNYEAIIGVPIPTQEFARPNGAYRTLRGVAMRVDPRVATLTKVSNIWQFPSDWSSPEHIAIITDGAKNFVVYAGIQGRPENIYRVGQLGPPKDSSSTSTTSSSSPLAASDQSKAGGKTDTDSQDKPEFDFGLGKSQEGSILSPDN